MPFQERSDSKRAIQSHSDDLATWRGCAYQDRGLICSGLYFHSGRRQLIAMNLITIFRHQLWATHSMLGGSRKPHFAGIFQVTPCTRLTACER